MILNPHVILREDLNFVCFPRYFQSRISPVVEGVGILGGILPKNETAKFALSKPLVGNSAHGSGFCVDISVAHTDCVLFIHSKARHIKVIENSPQR